MQKREKEREEESHVTDSVGLLSLYVETLYSNEAGRRYS